MAENHQINKYFDGEMTPEEMTNFENLTQQDPVLRKEFLNEKEIIEGIQNARKAELKTLLNNIDVSAINSSSAVSSTKVIMAIVASSIIILGGYWYFNTANQPNQQIITQVEEISDTTIDNPTNNTNLQSIVEPKVESKEQVQQKIIAKNQQPQKENNPQPIQNTNNKHNKSSVYFNSANVNDSFDEDTEEEESESLAPSNHLIAKSKLVNSTLEVTVQKSNKYTNHYKVKNGNLTLYGDFREVYEVIESHKDGNITTYFMYKNEYFLIDKNNKKPTELVALTGDQLLELLDHIENNKQR